MANRRFIFRCGSKELILPVTPAKYERSEAINVETININTIGEVNLAGEKALDTVKIACLLPARDYPFTSSSEPDTYITQLKKWCDGKNVLRFIIGNTNVNMPCIIESVSFGEQDGTNDVYADITLREYVQLRAVRMQANKTANAPRAPVEADRTLEEAEQSGNYTAYTPKEYDTPASVSALKYNRYDRQFGPIPVGELAGIDPRPRLKFAAMQIEKKITALAGLGSIYDRITKNIQLPNLKG